MNLNIRNEADRDTIETAGYTWVTVTPRGDNKGRVISRHRSNAAAEKAAKGRDLAIVCMDSAHYY
jgi:hypothetical protein